MNSGKARSKRYRWEGIPPEPLPLCPICGCRSSLWITDDLGAVLGCEKCLELRTPAALHKRVCPVCGSACRALFVKDRKAVGCDACTIGREAHYWSDSGLKVISSRRLRYC